MRKLKNYLPCIPGRQKNKFCVLLFEKDQRLSFICQGLQFNKVVEIVKQNLRNKLGKLLFLLNNKDRRAFHLEKGEFQIIFSTRLFKIIGVFCCSKVKWTECAISGTILTHSQ